VNKGFHLYRMVFVLHYTEFGPATSYANYSVYDMAYYVLQSRLKTRRGQLYYQKAGLLRTVRFCSIFLNIIF